MTGMAKFNRSVVLDFDCPVWVDRPLMSDFPKPLPSRFMIFDIFFDLGKNNLIKKPNKNAGI
jgi:hypothetical protein